MPTANPKPVCESLEPLTGDWADWYREQCDGTLAFLFDKGDGQWVSIERLIFHWTMKVGDVGDCVGYRTRYCYATGQLAIVAAAEWADRDWQGEPKWWHRHPDTGRRREAGDPAKETRDGE